MKRHPSSFRDPAGTVFAVDDRIVRGLTEEGTSRYISIKNSGLFCSLEATGKIITSKDINLTYPDAHFKHFIEHQLIDFISYPYEWPFSLLKDAALLHLDIQLEAMKKDIVLIDASAYNIQFRGINPVFIDILSFRPYQTGEFWLGHRQFCEQFLNPLLLTAIRNISYQDWYRGYLEGIPTEVITQLMPLKTWFLFKYLLHVHLPARGKKITNNTNKVMERSKKAALPKAVYVKFLNQLRDWITNLDYKTSRPSLWGNYITERLYSNQQIEEKQTFVKEFINTTQPDQLWDIGCNDGEFAEIAMQHGTKQVIGFDSDLGALEKAVIRAKKNSLNFLPLYQQVTNLTPSQGWLLKERISLIERALPDAILALAIIHHLALSHNLPLNEIVNFIVQLSPVGVIEFVPKTDHAAKKLLALKGDIFPNYTEHYFKECLLTQASIVKSFKLSDSERCLYWYERNE